MALIYGLSAKHPGTDEAKPHVLYYNVARVAANSLLFDIWNGATSAVRKASVDLNGKFYSAALTAGDLLYAVAGGVAGVKRLDSLAIGSAGQILRSTGTAPAWTTATFPATAAQGDLLYGSATNVWSSLAKGTANQLLRMNAGATAPEWASTLSGLTLTSPTITTGILDTPAIGNPTIAGITVLVDSGDGSLNRMNVRATNGQSYMLNFDGQETRNVAGVGGIAAGIWISQPLFGGTVPTNTASLYIANTPNLGTNKYSLLIGAGTVGFAAGGTGAASLRVPHGAAPTAPVDGDVWTTTAGIFVRVNGSTVGPLS